MTNKQQIQQITDAISINPDRSLVLNGKPWGEAFSNAYTNQPSAKMLFQSLQQLIYSTYYTRSGEMMPKEYPDAAAITEFLSELGRHNQAREDFDGGWIIEQVDMQGSITAGKGNYKRIVLPGEFLNESSFQQKPFVSTAIRIYARKEHASIHTGFYYLFGNTIAEDNPSMLVRLYFNIKPEGSKALVSELSALFNKYSIPFSFKCLHHPSLYTRADAAVLYFDKRYSDIIFRLLPEMYKRHSRWFNKDVPLFTRRIAAGLAFAENPLHTQESFGTHISKMITQGILHCFNQEIPKKNWTAEVISNITERHGYKNIEVLYLNPGSVYPYHFPTIPEQS